MYIWVLHNKSQFSTNTSGQVYGWIVSLTWISRNCCGFPYYLLPFQERKLVMWCCDEHWFTQLDFASKKSDKENAATEIDSSEMEFPRFWYVGKCPPPPKKKSNTPFSIRDRREKVVISLCLLLRIASCKVSWGGDMPKSTTLNAPNHWVNRDVRTNQPQKKQEKQYLSCKIQNHAKTFPQWTIHHSIIPELFTTTWSFSRELSNENSTSSSGKCRAAKKGTNKGRVQKNPTQKSQATHSSLFEPSPRMVTWRKTENMEAIREYAECAKTTQPTSKTTMDFVDRDKGHN